MSERDPQIALKNLGTIQCLLDHHITDQKLQRISFAIWSKAMHPGSSYLPACVPHTCSFPGAARLTHTHCSCPAQVLPPCKHASHKLSDRPCGRLSQGQIYTQDMLLSSSTSACPMSKVLLSGFFLILSAPGHALIHLIL